VSSEVVAAEPGSLLRNRDFVTFWGGETISVVGAAITELALLFTALVSLGASAFEVGLLNVVRFAPFVVLSLFVGVWLDRRRRRPVLIAANLGRGVLIGLIPLTVFFDVLSMELLYLIGFLFGALTVIFDIGSVSYVPGLVDRRHLTEANSKIHTSYSLASVGGPGMAGLLIGALTAPVTLFVSTVTYFASAVSLIFIARREPEPEPVDGTASVLSSIREGLRAVFSNRTLRNLATQSATFNFFQNVVITVFAVYAVRSLGLDAARLGFVLAAGAVGALIGAVFSNRLSKVVGVGNVLRISTLAGCLSPVLLLVPGGAGVMTLVVLALGLAVNGASLTMFNVNALTLRQAVTPDRLLGRMNASYRLLLFGTVPLGAFLGGVLADVFGLRAALAVGVCGVATVIAWIPFSPVFALREIPDSPDTSLDTRSTNTDEHDS
jgi:MFS family permease